LKTSTACQILGTVLLDCVMCVYNLLHIRTRVNIYSIYSRQKYSGCKRVMKQTHLYKCQMYSTTN